MDKALLYTTLIVIFTFISGLNLGILVHGNKDAVSLYQCIGKADHDKVAQDMCIKMYGPKDEK